MGLSRLLHFGPLVTLMIVKCISFTTLHFTSQWCYPWANWANALLMLSYYSLIAVTLYHFLCSVFVGPGYVPKGWGPKEKSDEPFLQYCHQCEAYKAPRSHHCSRCSRCVLKMDHHCPWLNNCVGYHNQKHFVQFLLYAVIGSFYSCTLLVIAGHRAIYIVPVRSKLLVLSNAFIFAERIQLVHSFDTKIILLHASFHWTLSGSDNRCRLFALYSGNFSPGLCNHNLIFVPA